MPNRLRKVKADEVSLVPRPANQFSDVLLAKNDPTPDDVHVPVPFGDRRKKKRRAGAEGDTDMPQIDKSALDPEVAEYVTKLEDSLIALQDEIEKQDPEPEDGVESLLKTADPALVEYVQNIQKAAEEAQAIAKAEQEARINREFLAKAAEMPNLGAADDVAGVLKAAAAALDSDTYAALEGMLAAANGKIDSGNLFAELGKAHNGPTDVESRIEKAAEEIRATDTTITKEQAIDLALRRDSSLYSAYLAEQEG